MQVVGITNHMSLFVSLFLPTLLSLLVWDPFFFPYGTKTDLEKMEITKAP